MTEAATTAGGTGSADYSDAYYLGGHLGPPCTHDEPHCNFTSVSADTVSTPPSIFTYELGLLCR